MTVAKSARLGRQGTRTMSLSYQSAANRSPENYESVGQKMYEISNEK
jgi:hypothetical protein